MLGLATYEQGICACGFHSSLTGDMSNVFQPVIETCPVCAGSARYNRVLAEQDKKATKALGEDPPASARLPDDGRHVFMRQLNPGEVQELRDKRSVRASEHVAHDKGRKRAR